MRIDRHPSGIRVERERSAGRRSFCLDLQRNWWTGGLRRWYVGGNIWPTAINRRDRATLQVWYLEIMVLYWRFMLTGDSRRVSQ